MQASMRAVSTTKSARSCIALAVVLALTLVLTLALTSSVALAQTTPSIRILKGDKQQTTYASAFASPLVVWVTDQATHRPMPGVQVHFVAQPGIALSSSDARTNARGLASVTATGAAACAPTVTAQIEGFPAASVTFEHLVVNKAPLTVVPADIHTAGGKLPPITGYTIQGFLNGDTAATAQITGAPLLTTTATDKSRHANYAIKGNPGSLAAPNYTFVPGFGTLAILRKSQTPADAELAKAESDPADDQEAVLTPAPEPLKTVSVRAAILKGSAPTPSDAARPTAHPIPARTLIASSAATTVAAAQPRSVPIQAAIANSHADATPRVAAPVRSVLVKLPAPVVQPAKPSAAPVRSAIAAKAPPATEAPKASQAAAQSAAQAAVRSVAMPEAIETPVASHKPDSVRKAFNPPAGQ